MITYLLIGVGVYLGVASCRLKLFNRKPRTHTVSELLLGLSIGVFAWPVALYIAATHRMDERTMDDLAEEKV